MTSARAEIASSGGRAAPAMSSRNARPADARRPPSEYALGPGPLVLQSHGNQPGRRQHTPTTPWDR
eukprot:365659-Alexandrium_andersonii.AAC.1